MTKGSNGYNQSGSKPGAMTGYGSSVPVKTTVSFKGHGGVEGSYRNTSRFSYGDKQSGYYGRQTTKEEASARDFEWKNGTTGTRNEYKESSTFRFGDKKGYTEVYNEQRVRDVVYDKSGCGSKNQISYNNDDDDDEDSGPYGGYSSDDGSGDGDEDGPSGGEDDYDDEEEDGSYGGSDCDNDDDDSGSDGGCGYDSDY